MRLSVSAATLVAALALPFFGSVVSAQTAAVPPSAVAPRTTPTLPPAASPTVPTTVGKAVTPTASPTAPTAAAKPVAPAVAPAAAPAAATTTATSAKKIDINAASEQEIATLPGIGPVTAKAIVEGRPWDELSALTTKKVMPQPVFDRNKDRFALANINTSSAADMAKTLPGIGDKTAPKIVNGRPYATPQDLVSKKVLTAGQFAKVKDVITY